LRLTPQGLVIIPITYFVQLQLRGRVRYRWITKGVKRVGTADPGTLLLCSPGLTRRVEWLDQTNRVLLSIEHPVTTKVLEETAAQDDVELQQSFEMRDRHIASLILALRADLEDGSPAGYLYGTT
jgi:AraC family transcriptional regulator